jgi:hypothetical protein
MLLRQFPCYDLQRLRNLLAALALAAPAFQTPYTFPIPNKTSDAVAAVTVVLSTGVGR